MAHFQPQSVSRAGRRCAVAHVQPQSVSRAGGPTAAYGGGTQVSFAPVGSVTDTAARAAGACNSVSP